MLRYEHSSWFAAPVEAVFAFHERPDALQLLLPRRPKVRILSPEAGIGAGLRVELRMYFGPFSVKWVALHTAYEKDRIFVDEQLEGPFQSWIHSHRFTREGDGARLTDSVDYVLPGGWIVEKLVGWFVQMELRKMFIYRHNVTAKRLHVS